LIFTTQLEKVNMRKFLLISFLFLISFVSDNKAPINNYFFKYSTNCLDILAEKIVKKTIVERKMKVRLTVYWAKGGNTDSDSAKRKSSSGSKLREGISVAVDPKLIPFYKRLYIPNLGLRVAHDTGTAVKNKKASNGKLPVIDVFFLNKRDALNFAYNNPKIVTVSVYKY